MKGESGFNLSLLISNLGRSPVQITIMGIFTIHILQMTDTTVLEVKVKLQLSHDPDKSSGSEELFDVNIQLTLKQRLTLTLWLFPSRLVSWSSAPASDYPAIPNQCQGTDRPGGKSVGHWGSVVGKGPLGPSVTVTTPYVSRSERSRLPQSSSLLVPM